MNEVDRAAYEAARSILSINTATATEPMMPRSLDYSKKLINDIRALLWVVTLGGLLLAALCIILGYTGSLPWIGAMVGLPWTAHGVICASYFNMATSDHKEGGITFEAAKAANFKNAGSENSPAI